MTASRALRFSVRQVLDDVENAAPVAAVEAVTRNIAAVVGAAEVSLLIAGVTGRDLVRLTHTTLVEKDDAPDAGTRTTRSSARERATTLPLDTGPPAQAMGRQTVVVVPPGQWLDGCSTDADHWVVLAPVIERGEALGLLQLCLPGEPEEDLVVELAGTAHLLAYVIIASRRHTDVYEWGQRTSRFSLSAEIQRRLLPAAYTCATGSFTLAAWLEPAASVGGDTFDYSVDRDVLHLGMTDARGHGVGSALTATLAVGALRNARRQGASLVDQADSTNEALLAHPGDLGEEFCTGLIGRVDLDSGTLTVVNAGHPPPYLVRDGEVSTVELPQQLPFGVMPSTGYTSTELPLLPGDRLVLVTDGMLERNATSLDLPALLGRTRALPPQEATRALADLVLDAVGHQLADDATLLVVDWHGAHDEDRATTSGAPDRP